VAIDLRSDTVTRPTPGMLAAMTSAEMGDDVYGEDPTVRALEERVAGLLGHQAGLYTVTGSLANMLGIRSWVRPGQELLCEAQAHVVRAELGGHASWHAVTTRTWTHPRGRIDLGAVRSMLSPDAGPYLVSTAAVTVENTHNFAGGSVQPISDLRALRDLVDGTGVRLHLDGARLWNAHIATGADLDAMGRLFDTVSVSLSKGLGAPIGSVLVGPDEIIADARQWRKRMGAGWRQAGVLAAAGIYALDHHLDRLAEDHDNAQMIAGLVAGAGVVDPRTVETNIVLLDMSVANVTASELVEAARTDGVLVAAVGPQVVRLITHLDVTADDCRKAGETLARLLGA
jgi:threonine aldolase